MKLGQPIPNSPHAVSVSLPAWADVVGYEEGEERVVKAMQLGYPRFVYHPKVRELCAAAEKNFARDGEFCLCLPSEKVAKLCVKFCGVGKINKFADGVFAVTLPEDKRARAKEFWQHAGLIVSSRRAEAALEGATEGNSGAKEIIKSRIAKLAQEKEENIYLYPSGMGAIFGAYKILGEGKTIQLGFPYVDTLKIQQKFGENIYLQFDEYEKLEKLVKSEKIAGVICEFPCNPLLSAIDLERVSKILRAANVPLIVDDTLASWANARVLDYADINVTSITKFFSGTGDVLAGSLILNSKSPLYSKLTESFDYEDLFFDADAEVLEKNSGNFDARIEKINENAEKITDWLKTQKGFEIYYTKGNKTFEKYKKQGYGGIFAIVFPTEAEAIKFYDKIDVKKGPSLGTNYTLICPYTLLAHYYELDAVRKLGVASQLIRISVGMEDFEELKSKFANALK